MRIASYNIRKAVGLDWRRDPGRILAVIEEIDADVLVLQEADRRTGRRAGVLPEGRLRDAMGYRLVETALREDSHGWHGNAIFLRAPLEASQAMRIPLPVLEPRGAVAARLDTPRIEIIGTHLALNKRVRHRQLTALRQHVQSHEHPVVIAGDFNHWGKPGPEFELLGDVVTPGPSFHSSRPVAALDRFILAGTKAAAPAFVHRSPTARRASDHLPIVIDLEIPEA